ncbi:MAG: oxaloacetate decarboxylase gamma subunit [Oceanicoccus sp.]|jgi:oxaloacetate decarboxylase gamma subunit
MQDNLMQQGVELMLYGMGTVFVFLAVLVVATTAMSALIARFAKPEPAIVGNARPIAAPNNANEPQLVAVITAAIHKYRSRHKQ